MKELDKIINPEPETVIVEVIADYPDGKYEKGDKIRVYKNTGRAYLLVSEPDGNCNVFDYPQIFSIVDQVNPEPEAVKTLQECINTVCTESGYTYDYYLTKCLKGDDHWGFLHKCTLKGAEIFASQFRK